MADFIVIANMGSCFDQKKEVITGVDANTASDLAWEMANEVYQNFEGNGGISDFDEFLEECDGDEESAREMYEEAINGWVSYYAIEITKDTPVCPNCGTYVCQAEIENCCFNCGEAVDYN